ncbi:MAG: hypothetical protein LH615_01525, partial [Ferruginibacter sp.]|nr:hypothetical protein [Ferruginibacter sp.]
MKHKLLLTIIICIFSFSFVNAQDPWIIQVYKELHNRQPSAWELNIKNYNLGTWNNYGELKSYIQEYQNSLIN